MKYRFIRYFLFLIYSKERNNEKKITRIVLIALLIGVLFIPIPSGVYKDGGTRTYLALTYKIVKWRKMVGETDRYQRTAVYWLPDNFKTLDELWKIEQKKCEQQKPPMKALEWP